MKLVIRRRAKRWAGEELPGARHLRHPRGREGRVLVVRDDGGCISEKRDKHGPPPGFTEERREWPRQRRKWVWEEGDIVIIRKRGRPEGEDSKGESPGR